MTVTARQSWTDERLDDLSARMEKRFDEVDRRFEKVEGEILGLRTEMNARFDSLQRTMVIGFVTMTATIVASIIGAILATQLVN